MCLLLPVAAGVEAMVVEVMAEAMVVVMVDLAAITEDVAAMEAIVALESDIAADLAMLMADASDAGPASSAGGHAAIPVAMRPTEHQYNACA